MSELLVRIVDKGGDALTQAGDVIAACPDGWGWGRMELANPEWIIIRVPGVDPAAFADMLEQQTGDGGVLLRKRGRGLDLASLPIGDARIAVIDADTLLAARRTKPSLAPIVRLG